MRSTERRRDFMDGRLKEGNNDRLGGVFKEILKKNFQEKDMPRGAHPVIGEDGREKPNTNALPRKHQ